MNKKEPDLSEKVMKTIKEEKIQMKPEWYFILGSVLTGIGAFSLLSIAMFTSNLFFFHLRMRLPMPGHFWLYRFPWEHLLLAIGTIIAGLFFLKKYEFSYQKNWKLIVLLVLTLILISGFFVDQMGINERLGKRRELKGIYRIEYPRKPMMLRQ